MASTSLDDSNRNTYSGSITGLVGVAGDILTFTAPTTNLIMRLMRLSITAVATAATDTILTLVKRSTLDTGGTSAGVSTTPHDSNWGNASTVVTSYTAAPAPGTLVGSALRTAYFNAALTGTGQAFAQTWQFGDRASACPRIYGPKLVPGQPAPLPTQQLALNVSSSVAGVLYNIDFEFTEDIM
jgi:hypothetical protein